MKLEKSTVLGTRQEEMDEESVLGTRLCGSLFIEEKTYGGHVEIYL